MANEIKVMCSVSCTKGSFVIPKVGSTEFSLTQTTAGGGSPGFLSIGTSEEDITFTDITTPGIVWFQNLDSTNFIIWGPKSAGAMVECGRLLAGDPPACFRLGSSVTLRMKADTAACKLRIFALET